MTWHSFEPLKYDQTNNVVIEQRITDEDLFNSLTYNTWVTSKEANKTELSKMFDKDTKITQVFWWNARMYRQFWLKWHDWVDIWTSVWTKIYAPIDWWLESSNDYTWYWKNVAIRNKVKDSKWNVVSVVEVIIWHMSRFSKHWNYEVKAWELIWLSWNTGNSTWPHVHLWIRFHNVDTLSEDNPWWDILDPDNWFQWWIDPLSYFNSDFIKWKIISWINE